MSRSLDRSAALGDDPLVTGRIYSVGYEGLRVSTLIDHLTSFGVTLLVDVRLNPISRKPGWSKRSLQADLQNAGIEYQHQRGLGNPPDNRESFRKGDGAEGRRRMREILSNGSSGALRDLVNQARERNVAVLCVERGSLHCHRQVVTDMAQELDPGIEVVHIA